MNEQLIFTDKHKLGSQIGYNNEWCGAVNNATDELKELVGGLSDEQLAVFVNNPDTLASELVDAAKREYDAYTQTIPASVRLSMSFCDGGLPDKIKAMHRKLQVKKPARMIDATSIKDGECILSKDGEARLLKECSIYGGERAARAYELSVKASEALNELHKAIKGNNAMASAVECWGRWAGFISISDDKDNPYKANPDMLASITE